MRIWTLCGMGEQDLGKAQLFPCERHERIRKWLAPKGRGAAPTDGFTACPDLHDPASCFSVARAYFQSPRKASTFSRISAALA